MRRLVHPLAFAVAALLAIAAGHASDLRTRLQGRWLGTIGEAAESTTVFVDVDTLAAGRWIAEADIPAQDIRDFPLGVETSGDTVRFHLGREGADGPVLSGRVDPRGTVIKGTFSQGGTASPAHLTKVGPPAISDALLALSSDSASALDITVLSEDARELRRQFNAHANRVRLVMLLSPT